jgi:MYXO-CTERM domain-containing protein
MSASAAPQLAETGTGLLRDTWVTRLEAPLAVGALVVLAIHVVDDNFLQPQPGTSAGDHLVSGLVPLAVLVGCAAVYSHLRPGLRAALAIALGLLGVVVGLGEAGYYSLHGGPSGDDYTGLLAIPAGLALVVVGAATLWRTRRRDDSLRRRYLRRSLLLLGEAIAFAFLVFPLSLSYVFTHAGRTGLPPARLGAPHENVAFRTSDGLTLRGWYVLSRNGAAVVAFPGRKGPQRQARMLVRHGYGVLLFDRRGEGESDGDPNAFGWAMDRDLIAAATFLRHRRDVEPDRIGGIGLSVGGEMLLQAAAESSAFKAVVSEGAGARSVRENLEKPLTPGTLSEVGVSFMFTAGTALFSNHWPPPNLKKLVGRIAPRSVFLIYALHGTGGEEKQLNPKYYAAAGEPKQIWEIPEASHTGGIEARPQEYERRVIRFFDRALLG